MLQARPPCARAQQPSYAPLVCWLGDAHREPPTPHAPPPQAKAGSGLVDGAASVDELVEKADGFAEVFPEHKFEIVDILQNK